MIMGGARRTRGAPLPYQLAQRRPERRVRQAGRAQLHAPAGHTSARSRTPRGELAGQPGLADPASPPSSTVRGVPPAADDPPQPKGPWTIWRWSGGAPVKITTLPPLGQSPYYGVGAIAW
jgi:hypothetical protein